MEYFQCTKQNRKIKLLRMRDGNKLKRCKNTGKTNKSGKTNQKWIKQYEPKPKKKKINKPTRRDETKTVFHLYSVVGVYVHWICMWTYMACGDGWIASTCDVNSWHDNMNAINEMATKVLIENLNFGCTRTVAKCSGGTPNVSYIFETILPV